MDHLQTAAQRTADAAATLLRQRHTAALDALMSLGADYTMAARTIARMERGLRCELCETLRDLGIAEACSAHQTGADA